MNTDLGIHNESEELLRNEVHFQEPGEEDVTKEASILRPLCETFGPYFMIGVLIQLVLICLTYASPQILQ